MEGQADHSASATDRALLPRGDPQSPAAVSGAEINAESESIQRGTHAGAANSGVRADEKNEPVSPMRQSARDVSLSSLKAQSLDKTAPTKNGDATEKRRTVGERLKSTLAVAKVEQAKYAKRAAMASKTINFAMFAQVVINALVTGLSASQNNRHAQIGVSALGAIGTILASFMVRVRGTREPERSVTHSQNLEKFIRELEAFVLDEGLSRNTKWDPDVKRLRLEFDKLQTAAHQSENGQPTAQPTA